MSYDNISFFIETGFIAIWVLLIVFCASVSTYMVKELIIGGKK